MVVYRLVRAFGSVDKCPRERFDRPARRYAVFLLLTLGNPLTIAYFAALILGLGANTLSADSDKLFFVFGAFAASAAWQLILAVIGAVLHHRLPERARMVTSIIGNVLIAGLAVRLALGA